VIALGLGDPIGLLQLDQTLALPPEELLAIAVFLIAFG
jgi:hypothetical protein